MATRVWIAQCLCPARHCILAAAGEAASVGEATTAILDPLREEVERMLVAGPLNPWCGLCGAKSDAWRFELGRTKFRNMAAAAAKLRESEAQQAVTRAAFGDLRRSD